MNSTLIYNGTPVCNSSFAGGEWNLRDLCDLFSHEVFARMHESYLFYVFATMVALTGAMLHAITVSCEDTDIIRKPFLREICISVLTMLFSRLMFILYGLVYEDYSPTLLEIMRTFGFPSLVAAFGFIQLAFFHYTKLKKGSKLLRNEFFVRTALIMYLFLSVVKAIFIPPFAAAHSRPLQVIGFIGDGIFICWSLFLYGNFLYISRDVFAMLRRIPISVMQATPGSRKGGGIPQLAVLAPSRNNLASSVTAALMPTLLATQRSMTNEPATQKVVNGKPSTSVYQAKPPGASIMKASTSISEAAIISPQAGTSEPSGSDMNKIDPVEGPSENPKKVKKLTWQASIDWDKKESTMIQKCESKSRGKFPAKNDVHKISVAQSKVNQAAPFENKDLLHSVLAQIAYANRSAMMPPTAQPNIKTYKRDYLLVIRLIFVAATLGVIATGFEIIRTFGTKDLLGYLFGKWDAVVWLTFEVAIRIVEIMSAVIMVYITGARVNEGPKLYENNNMEGALEAAGL